MIIHPSPCLAITCLMDSKVISSTQDSTAKAKGASHYNEPKNDINGYIESTKQRMLDIFFLPVLVHAISNTAKPPRQARESSINFISIPCPNKQPPSIYLTSPV
jgi:hypothetical protein